jgi:anaphase-promoting complex subunit 11
MKVKIKSYSAVATWHWDVPEDDVCGICRVQFDGTCPTCKFPGDDCSLSMLIFYYSVHTLTVIVVGKCGHAFHMVNFLPKARYKFLTEQHCLLTWINQESSRNLCPMCRQSKSYHLVEALLIV